MSGKAAKTGFTDKKEIADWAKESASALVSWAVMEGTQDGSFSPLGNFTVEQCVVSFLRLYVKGAVSRKNGNVVPVFTYEEGLEYVAKRSDSAYEKLRCKETRCRNKLKHPIRPGLDAFYTRLSFCSTGKGRRPKRIFDI